MTVRQSWPVGPACRLRLSVNLEANTVNVTRGYWSGGAGFSFGGPLIIWKITGAPGSLVTGWAFFPQPRSKSSRIAAIIHDYSESALHNFPATTFLFKAAIELM